MTWGFFVEILGGYSKRTDVRSRLDRILQLPQSEQRLQQLDTSRQRHRRLTDEQTVDIVAGYLAGESVYALANRHQISRQRVSVTLERQGVKRRYNILTPQQIELARQLYEQGRSLADVGNELNVSSKTVLKALRSVGVQTRPVGTNQWTLAPLSASSGQAPSRS